MMRKFAGLRPATLGLAYCIVVLLQNFHPAHAAERVQFESARYQVGPLQRRLALERHEPLIPAPAAVINGYLTKPGGPGPFPAIVHLHGCGGLPENFKTAATKGQWSEQLAAWGYVVLAVDSFTARGINNTCSYIEPARVADAYGALAYLSHQPFVDANRIAVIGFSAGGIAALSIAESRDFELFENEAEHGFKAAVAFYPTCASDNAMKMPTLILIGGLDDWSRAAFRATNQLRRRPDISEVANQFEPRPAEA